MASNFKLFKSVLTSARGLDDYDLFTYFQETGDTEVLDTSFSSDHKGKLSYNVGNDHEITFTNIVSDGSNPLNIDFGYIFMGGFSGVKPESISILYQSSIIASPTEVSQDLSGAEYMVFDTEPTSLITGIKLTYASDASGVSNFYPPFFGTDDMGGLISSGKGFENGRKYGFTGEVSYQQTKTQSFPQAEPNFTNKEFTVKILSEVEQQNCFDFLQENNGRLVLMVEGEPTTKHGYLLGFLNSGESTAEHYDAGEIAFNIKSKFAS